LTGSTGLTFWALLAPLLRLWLYRAGFLGVAFAGVALVPTKPSTPGHLQLVNLRGFATGLLGGQTVAGLAMIIFVGELLDWQTHPVPTAVEAFAGTDWHFVLTNAFTEWGLALAVLATVWTGYRTWTYIGVRRPTLSLPVTFMVVAAAYVILRFILEPVSLGLWQWCLGLIAGHFGQHGNAVDMLKVEAWMARETFNQVGMVGRILIALWLGILVPAIEEVFFRGLLLTALLERVSTWLALTGQALVFALLHVDLVRLPYLLVFGLMLGYLAKRTSSLLPPVLLHILVNIIAAVTAMA